MVGRVVGIADGLLCPDRTVFGVEFHVDFIIRLLLPVTATWRAGGGTVNIWRGQRLFQLCEGARAAAGDVNSLDAALSNGDFELASLLAEQISARLDPPPDDARGEDSWV